MNYKLRFNRRGGPQISAVRRRFVPLTTCAERFGHGIIPGLCSLCLLLNSSAPCRPGSLGVKRCEIARFFALNALALKPFADSRNFLPPSVIHCFGRLGFYGYPVNFTGGWGMGGA